MPPPLDEGLKERVWRLCLSGETRNNIAEICGIGAGSVTNIINEFTKDLDSSEYGAIRVLSIQLKKEGLTFAELASMYRRHNYICKMGANEEEIETLILNLLNGVKSIPPEKIVNLVNQLFQLSKSESIPPVEVPYYVKQKIEEKERLEEEIQKAREILDQNNVDIRTIEEYKKLEDEFKKYSLSMEASSKLVSVLQTINEMGYDSQKIVASLARIKSLRQTERRLKKSCKIWESRAAWYQKIFPLCERVVSMGIGIPLLLALETAVIKRTELDGVPAISAPYRVLQDIDDYNRLGGMKKQFCDMIIQINIMREILARQNNAVVALMKLQLCGIKEDQILRLCRVIDARGHNLNSDFERSIDSNSYPVPEEKEITFHD